MRDFQSGYVPPADNIPNWQPASGARVALQERIEAERAARRNPSQGLSTADQPEQVDYVAELAHAYPDGSAPVVSSGPYTRASELMRDARAIQPEARFTREEVWAAFHAAPPAELSMHDELRVAFNAAALRITLD